MVWKLSAQKIPLPWSESCLRRVLSSHPGYTPLLHTSHTRVYTPVVHTEVHLGIHHCCTHWNTPGIYTTVIHWEVHSGIYTTVIHTERYTLGIYPLYTLRGTPWYKLPIYTPWEVHPGYKPPIYTLRGTPWLYASLYTLRGTPCCIYASLYTLRGTPPYIRLPVHPERYTRICLPTTRL